MSGALSARLAAAEGPLIETEAGALRAGAARLLSPDADPGARVLVSLRDPARLVAALVALDGRVAEMLLVSHAQPAEVAAALAAAAGCDRVLTDRPELGGLPLAPLAPLALAEGEARATAPTRWLMTTSGTTGTPKIVPHTLGSLAATVRPASGDPRWALLYDPTRFAGLQVTLQALIGGGVLLAPDTSAPLAAQLAFLAARGCDHLSATPTLWRRLLMTPGFADLPLRQATLGGEIADQPVLDALAAALPRARVTHVFASTEAGVGFSVRDGRAGFPAEWLEAPPPGAAIRVRDGLLWLKPRGFDGERIAADPVTRDPDGFILTGDLVETREGRVLFLGRESGVINVGGVKVHPERVEREIAAVPGVALVRVSAKKSAMTGQLIVAEVAPKPEATDREALKAAILARCRERLEREATPAIVRFVEDFEVNAAGKLVRGGKG